MQGSSTTESYSYDAVGNRLSSLGLSPYSYNTSNQLTATPSATYTYDYNGNTTSKTDAAGTTTYNWNAFNQLTSVVLPGASGTVSFKYDPFGRRVQKSGPSGTVDYLYDGKNVIQEVDQSGGTFVKYLQSPGVDEPLTQLRSSTVSYYQQDGLGSVTSLTDSNGGVANTYTYDDYGKLVTSTGMIVNTIRYSGREFDTETGTYYNRARYFDPQVGRFVSEDPIGFLGGINKYAYVLNRPVNYSDPLGLDCPEFPIDCVHSPGDRAQMQREHDEMMQQIVGPEPTAPEAGINEPPPPQDPSCECSRIQVGPQTMEQQLEGLAGLATVFDAAGETLLGTGLAVGGVVGGTVLCVTTGAESVGIGCVAGVEIAGAGVAGGYYIAHAGVQELIEIYHAMKSRSPKCP